MQTRDSSTLIASDKVEGTSVYGAHKEKIGTIERLMIEKTSGTVSYAVLSFGGILGIGDDHYPLPWSALRYEPSLGGYLTDLTDEKLRGAPKFERAAEWDWADQSQAAELSAFYGVPLGGV